MELEGEIWKSAAPLGFGKYVCSNMGRVKNVEKDKILTGNITPKFYRTYKITNDDGEHKIVKGHFLILTIFSGPKCHPKQTPDHINRKRLDNRISNLRWASPKLQADNSSHSSNKKAEKFINLILTIILSTNGIK